jgi:hypothetical protein
LRKLLLIALIANVLSANAQLVEVGIAPSATSAKSKKTSARTQALEPMVLPFWDDFSFTQDKDFPNDTLWESGRTVWVNHGRAINPPSVFTATFDGISSTGKPHDAVEVLSKGFADTLLSRSIKLDALPLAQKDSVYMSFFYQVTGKGEAPDQDDKFSLWFKDTNGTWEKVFEVKNSVALDNSVFYYAIVKVEERFHHNAFQFKFHNFARLSGPYDTWNLDYVYLNDRRWAEDEYFPDRTQVQPVTSIFERYRAIPMEHYRDTATTVTIAPKAYFTNLYDGQPNQPADYSSYATIKIKKDGIETESNITIELNATMPDVPLGSVLETTLASSVPTSAIDLDADSVWVKFKLGFDSGDTNPVAETPRYVPVDFLRNDTTEAEFYLLSHYAYDDGTAEYGAGLNRPGSELAYGFPMFTKEPDTLVAVDIYFPEFGDNSNQTVILKIWSAANDGPPNNELYRGTVTVQRTQFNTFTRYNLVEAIIVKNKFFIGWEQTASVVVPAGLDKNTDSGDDIYANISGVWEQNQNVRGSLMIHPIFGTGVAAVINGAENQVNKVYPNPTSGEFFISGAAANISICNVMGASQYFESLPEENRTRISVFNQANQLLLVRWQANGKFHSARVLIRN